MLTTREGYGTSLDLVLWEVLINESLVVVVREKCSCWDERDGYLSRFSIPRSIGSCFGWAGVFDSTCGSLVGALVGGSLRVNPHACDS